MNSLGKCLMFSKSQPLEAGLQRTKQHMLWQELNCKRKGKGPFSQIIPLFLVVLTDSGRMMNFSRLLCKNQNSHIVALESNQP